MPEPSTAKPVGHTEKVVGTPHFYQCDPRAKFPEEGRNYCGPTAVSDSLVYLAGHGFPKLLPEGNTDPTETQIALIKQLADYMNTDPTVGTNAGHACDGIKKYVEASGYTCKSIEFRGWARLTKEMATYATASLAPMKWIKEGASGSHSAAWLSLGWYVSGTKPNEWKRVGGHWVAVVGYGVDGDGREDPNVLLVVNPGIPPVKTASASSSERQRLADGTEVPTNEEIAGEVVTTTMVLQDRLILDEGGKSRDAVGMYRVAGPGVHLSKKYDAAFIDGAVVLVIGERKP